MTFTKKNNSLVKIFQIAVVVIWIKSTTTLASTEAEKGLEIAREADYRDQGFGDISVDLTMVMGTADGSEISRQMRQMTLEVADDGDKSIMVIDRPADLKGTAILTYTHRTGPDDQWLYLPVLKRVKRISSADRSGPFMGSEFAYEDLASQEVEKYQYRFLREEPLNGENCFVIERIPVDENSGYTRHVAWIDQAEYRLQRVDYFDRKGDALKTMEFIDYQQYLEKHWRPQQLHMTNHQTANTTTLYFDNYRFSTGLTAANFNRNALSRIR